MKFADVHNDEGDFLEVQGVYGTYGELTPVTVTLTAVAFGDESDEEERGQYVHVMWHIPGDPYPRGDFDIAVSDLPSIQRVFESGGIDTVWSAWSGRPTNKYNASFRRDIQGDVCLVAENETLHEYNLWDHEYFDAEGDWQKGERGFPLQFSIPCASDASVITFLAKFERGD